ncbi:MAG: penicillin-binding transpeptidase domain-containing protein, partial [Chitinophagales bacterium]
QFQQISFLNRFYHSQLPITERTQTIMKRLMVIDENEQYKLSGKTGWAIRNDNNIGWFVGYLESKGKVYFFATNVTPNETFNMNLFPKIRSEVTMSGFEALGII